MFLHLTKPSFTSRSSIRAMSQSGRQSPRNIHVSDFASRPKDCLLFYCRESERLAKDIAKSSPKVQLGEIHWEKFEDGFPKLFVRDALHIRNRHVAFLASFSSSEAIFDQISVIYALPRLFVSSFTLVLPFFPTGTHERVEAEGEVATAFTLARILSNIPLSRGGPTSLVTYDIHALQERFYFGDAVLPLFESGIPLLLDVFSTLPDREDITVAYPDDGSWKRFHRYFPNFPEVICTKIRKGNERIVKLKEGNVEGRHIVMVDDLVRSGGTLIECHAVLAANGAKHVSAYVTHSVFPNKTWKRFKAEQEDRALTGFKYFWTTDSCSETIKQIRDVPPFQILSLAEAIAETLQI